MRFLSEFAAWLNYEQPISIAVNANTWHAGDGSRIAPARVAMNPSRTRPRILSRIRSPAWPSVRTRSLCCSNVHDLTLDRC